jgi:hypothetical protein
MMVPTERAWRSARSLADSPALRAAVVLLEEHGTDSHPEAGAAGSLK